MGFVAVDALKNGAEAEAGAAGPGGATTGVAKGDVTAPMKVALLA